MSRPLQGYFFVGGPRDGAHLSHLPTPSPTARPDFRVCFVRAADVTDLQSATLYDTYWPIGDLMLFAGSYDHRPTPENAPTFDEDDGA